MKIGIIVETKEFEKAWNALVFLMGEAVECEGLVHEKFNVDEQLKNFVSIGGEILACGTCLKSRQKAGTEACPLSTMIDCLKMVEWADKVVTF
ncbi:MAG: DsrE family protein [Elusimicrobia bacterium]|nr:DsrE family protein [Elusimicrobiota bacterium]